ncbi:MAG TPA: tetratricopeptide repeat protein [Chakrabartia sp.]|nr:tetratricopeptide repeat protein [Chakrabartia sp.]
MSGDPAKAAQAAMASYDYETARVHLANALKDNGNDPNLIFLDGELALASGDPERAKSAFERLASDPKWAARAVPLLAKAQLMGGSPQLALETLAGAGKLNDVGHAVSISCKFTTGKAEEAVAELDSALLAFPDSLDLGVIDGSRAMAQGDLARAKSVADRLTAKYTGHPDALMFAGRVALARKDLGSAAKHFAGVVEHQPGHQTALLALAAIARDKGDTKAAAEYATKAYSKSPGNPVATYFMAEMALDSGDLKGAAKLLQGVEEAQNQLPALAMLNGLLSARQGNHEQAIAHLQRYFSLGGEDGRARLALAASLSAAGDKANAWTTIQPLADAANATAPVLKLAASLAGELKLPNAASYAVRAAKAGAGDPIAAPMKAADAALRAGDWKKADGIYASLLAQGNGDNVMLLNNAANARLELGDPAGAITLARRAQAVAPKDPIVLDTLGWALFKGQGDSPEVTQLLTEAARLMPGNTEIQDHVNAVAHARSRKPSAV